MQKSISELTIEELLESLPNHLHLARNDSAPDHDRWRVFNRISGRYIETGCGTAREVLELLEQNRRKSESWEFVVNKPSKRVIEMEEMRYE